MARVAQVMNLQFEVHLQRWNDKNCADKRCECRHCGTPVALHGFLLTEADKVVDKRAEVAVHGSVYSIWREVWRMCSFNGDESMCGRADGTCDTDVLEIMNAARC